MENNSKIIKVLANGYEVPYPDELEYRDIIVMKDYRLNDFPRNSEGEFDETAPYEEWLSEYLFHCELSLTVEQRKLADHISNGNFSGILLGFHAGIYESLQALRPAYSFPTDFSEKPDIDSLKGITGGDPYQEYLAWVEEDERLSRPAFVMEEYGWHLMKQQEQEDFRKYWPAFLKLEPLNWMFGLKEQGLEFPDAAWRPYLALILKRIPDRTARMRELYNFFDEYGDAIHK